MGNLDYQRTVIGYHGCDKSVANRIFLGEADLEFSSNNHDWLGKGIYFWEYGPARAFEWAKWRSQVGGPGVEVRVPTVVGAHIHLGKCFDLLDTTNTRLLAQAFALYKADCEAKGLPLPVNQRAGKTDADFTKRLL